jgi:hypothetical protein
MPDLTAKDWIETLTPEQLAQIRTKESPDNVPATLTACHQDPNWWKMLRRFANSEFSGENVDFLDAVDKFNKQPTLASAQEIYQLFVSPVAARQINLSDPIRNHYTQWFDPDVFDVAYEEVSGGEDQDRDEAFRLAVDNWRQRGRGGAEAKTIYDDHVRDGAVGRVHLSESTRTALLDAMAAAPPDAAGFFDDAYKAIFAMVEVDTYIRFGPKAEASRAMLKTAIDGGQAAISQPGKAEAPQGRSGQPTANKPDQATLNDWNKKALNALQKGQETDFFQVGEVVIIANAAGGMPPGVVWAQQQSATTGRITMTQRAGAFDAGSMTVTGASDSEAFKKGVAGVSKRRLEYA